MEYRVIRTRRKTISIQIAADGNVIVRCPLQMCDERVHSFVMSKSRWIEKHLAKIPAVQTFTQQQLKELSAQAKIVLAEKTAHFAKIMGVSYGRITIRAQHTRWGSCSAKGNLNFNCLLMLMPSAVQDYVVVHELCHLRQMNHSSLFWAEVERVLPNYRETRKLLKDNGKSLLYRLPK